MLIFICPNCGRFGIQAVKEVDGKVTATCPYCGTEDIDWISRPDIEEAVKAGEKTEEELLCVLEKSVLNAMAEAYDIYDDVTETALPKKNGLLSLQNKLET